MNSIACCGIATMASVTSLLGLDSPVAVMTSASNWFFLIGVVVMCAVFVCTVVFRR